MGLIPASGVVAMPESSGEGGRCVLPVLFWQQEEEGGEPLGIVIQGVDNS
ncbi:MAG TPA: hypothetical protein VKY90_13405 [Candidatus Dormibacteraeota bacterium]|nr:hypothetical protein [Candidatus Dormibacteraeota bacterium]